MWTQDLVYCLGLMAKHWPDALVERIDSYGIIYLTCDKRISLRGFLDCPEAHKVEWLSYTLGPVRAE